MDYSVRPATNSMIAFVKDVKCTGRELSVLGCSFRRDLTSSQHSKDVSVQCTRGKAVRTVVM